MKNFCDLNEEEKIERRRIRRIQKATARRIGRDNAIIVFNGADYDKYAIPLLDRELSKIDCDERQRDALRSLALASGKRAFLELRDNRKYGSGFHMGRRFLANFNENDKGFVFCQADLIKVLADLSDHWRWVLEHPIDERQINKQ